MEILGTILSGILSGGATGLLGVIFQRYADYKNKQLDMQIEKQRGELELQKRQIDIQVTQAEYAGKTRVAEVEGATASDVAETQAFAQTLWKEPDRYSSAANLTVGQQWILILLDAVRGSVRPLLTLYLCALTTFVWYQVKTTLGAAHLDTPAALVVWQMVVQQILYLTTTVTLWWFGTRNKQVAPTLK